MIRTMYTVNRNMNVLQKKQENTSGNLANSHTPGYKFKSIMQSTLEPYEMINHAAGINKDRKQVLGDFVFGNQIDEKITDLKDGTPYESGNFTDFSIQGDGFFTIELLGGGRGYTRNGNFKIGEDGFLATQTGERVLGQNNGTVGVISADESFRIDSNGGFIGSNGTFLISEFNNYDDAVDRGNTIFTSTGGVTTLGDSRVMQGYLESSNVDFTGEMIRMIEISREFESNQKMIQTADETLSKAVNELGRL